MSQKELQPEVLIKEEPVDVSDFEAGSDTDDSAAGAGPSTSRITTSDSSTGGSPIRKRKRRKLKETVEDTGWYEEPVEIKTEPQEFDIQSLHWTKKTSVPPTYENYQFCEPLPGILSETPIDISSPKSIFFQFFTEDFVQHILYQSNLFATQANVKLDLKREEFLSFLGILIIMGFHKLPGIRDYWSQNRNLRVERIQNVMPVNRFVTILRFLHLNDDTKLQPKGSPGFDHLHKLRPMMTTLNRKFKELYQPSRFLTIEESTLSIKGESDNPRKIDKRIFKIWVLCDSETGYALDVGLYWGGLDKYFRAEILGNIVKEATKDYANKGYVLHFDAHVSSIGLVGSLLEKGIFCCGNLHQFRPSGFPQDVLRTDSQMTNEGDLDYAQAGDVSILKWRSPFSERNIVCMITTAHDPKSLKPFKRNEDVRMAPEALLDYQERMKGFQHFKHLLTSYMIDWKSRRPWMKFFFYMTDVAIVNSYILYKTTFEKMFPNAKQPLSNIMFRSKLADELIGNYSCNRMTGRRSATYEPPSERRFEGVGEHLPIRLPTRSRVCANCSLKKRSSRSKMGCTKCDVALCLPCFSVYHTRGVSYEK